MLVGQDNLRAPRLQAHTSYQAGTRIRLAATRKFLLVEIVEREGILAQHPLQAPFRQRSCRSRIAVIQGSIARLIPSEFQANNVVWMAGVVACLRLR